jgi:hypothetical protein
MKSMTRTRCKRFVQSVAHIYWLLKKALDRDEIAAGSGRQWKWAPLSPVEDIDKIIHFGEGATPYSHLKKREKLSGFLNCLGKMRA